MSAEVAMGFTFLLGLLLGLFWGERGRRLAAERWKVYGTPEAPQAASVSAQEESHDSVATPVSESAIDRGAAELKAMMSQEGYHLTDAEYREQARQMLAESLRR